MDDDQKTELLVRLNGVGDELYKIAQQFGALSVIHPEKNSLIITGNNDNVVCFFGFIFDTLSLLGTRVKENENVSSK